MKNIYFSLLSLALSFLSFSQTVRVDYDNSSKWFLGINGGGTWHSTDLKYQVGGGWGLTLGKSYNYNYGRPLTFDIRGRYLNGNWYGQDKDSTALTGLTQDNALYGYQSTPGYTYHNFKSNIHRLALELAIHLNAITQRTGWDPYVFGGVGITWNQTKGNLTDSSEIMLGANPYNYGPNGLGGITFDDSYETPLDGYKKYNVNFMPSLGFGLGYHIGKRTTFGIEHKTTFTLADEFDAVQSIVRPKNDLYHYTSLYLQFRFRGRLNGDYSVGNNSNGNVNGFTSNCPPPLVTIANNSNITVTNPQFDIDFRVTEITSQNAIQVLNGNNVPVFFNFNTSSKQGRASVTLVPGVNTFTIKARNRCGTDTKTYTVIFNNCSLPSGSFTNPNPSGATVKSPAFVLGAIVHGVQNKSAIRIYSNGSLLTNFSYNSQNGVIQANVNLNLGQNNFRIELSNACGNGTIESNVNYDNCLTPSVLFLAPSASGTTVNSSNLQLRANVIGVTTNQQINLDINGVAVRNFNFTNGLITTNLTLSAGANTITLRVSTPCGIDTESVTINFQLCNAPVITVTSPTQNAKVTSSILRLRTKIENIQAKNNIKIQLNGVDVNTFNFTAGANGAKTADASLNLREGLNAITISATNACGTDVETILVEYDNCQAPLIDITSSTNETTNNSYILSAAILNMSDATGITVTRNGQDIGFNYSSGQLISAVSLLPGANTFVVKAVKACGNASKTITVNYRDCEAPTINLLTPNAGNSVNSAQSSYSARVTSITALNQVIVTLNGQVVNSNLTADVVSGSLLLVEGLNTLTIKVTNACGMDSKTITLTRVVCTPPTVTIINPTESSTVTRAGLAFEASVVNATNYSVTLNGNTTTTTKTGNTLRGNLTLVPGSNVIVLTANNSCGNASETITVTYNNCVAPIITIASGNSMQTVNTSSYAFSGSVTNSIQSAIAFTLNGVQKPFVLSGTTLSANLSLLEGLNVLVISTSNACGSDTKTVTLNYVIPVNNNGASGGSSNNGNNGSTNGGNSGNTEEKIIICHYPPGNTGNPQQLEIPLSAWPAHQAHGDVLGPCPNVNNGNGNNGSNNGNGNNGSTNGGNSGNTEEKIIICHYPPGNTGNPQQLEIPLSAWPAHQAHGDVLGPCPNVNNGNNGSNGNSGNNGSNNGGNSGSGSSGNGNNGHGNNEDGVDVSNPGQGNGGPNGTPDQSGSIDDESTGNGNTGNSSGNNGSSGGETGSGTNTNGGATGNGSQGGNSNSSGSGSTGGNGNSSGSNGNGNNGHGNNEDGVDVSNPGQGNSSGNNGSSGGENGSGTNSNGGATGNGLQGGNSNSSGSGSAGGNGNSSGNGNGNNGHGNNEDGVDVSNPGQGDGGPNGTPDQSGSVDDESTGNGNTDNSSGNSGSSGGETGSGSNSNGGATGNGSQGGNSNSSGSGSTGGNGNSSGSNGNGSNGNETGNNGSGSNGGGGNTSNGCLTPVITLPNMMRGGIVVSNSTYTLLGSVANYGSTGQISVLFNNNNIPVNISADESFISTVTLNLGVNTFVVNTANNCGSDSKSFTVELVSGNLQNNQNNGGGNNQNGGQKSQQTGSGSNKTTIVKPNGENQSTKPSGNSNSNNGVQQGNKPTVNTNPQGSPQNNKPSVTTNTKPQENIKPIGNGNSNSNNGGQQGNKPTVNTNPQGSPQNNKPSGTTNTKPQENNKPNGNGNQGSSAPKPTNNKPQVTNKPAQTGGVKPNPSGTKPEEKPKENKPNEVKPNTGPKVNGTNKGGGK